MRDERGLREFHQFEDIATRGGGTVLSDVFRDIVETVTSELCPSKPQAASPGKRKLLQLTQSHQLGQSP